MTTNLSSARQTFANVLFVGAERLGWEYVEPPARVPSPILDRRPYWYQPPPPPLGEYRTRYDVAMTNLPKRTLILGGVALVWAINVAMQSGASWLWLLLLLVLAAAWLSPIFWSSHQMKKIVMRAADERDRLYARYLADEQAWAYAVQAHDHAELRRYEAALRWHPVRLHSNAGRIDVFGGTSTGWASLLTTFGTSVLANEGSLLVLDFTEQDIGADLLRLAAEAGWSAQHQQVPDTLGSTNLLSPLNPLMVPDVLADALQSMRPGPPDADLRDLDVTLISAVTDHLEQPLTLPRITAGLRIFQRRAEATESPHLSPTEASRLTAVIDDVPRDDRAASELRLICNTLALLQPTPDTPGSTPLPNLFHHRGLTVFQTGDANDRRKEFADRLLLQVVHQVIRAETPTTGPRTLVVAGADHVGRPALELLARRARIAHVRLVLMIENLRDDLKQLLGGSDSVAVLMRLGNPEQASYAADFIGRGHKFVLSQLTRQVGIADTHGASDTHGTSYGTSTTRGTSSTSGPGPSSSTGTSNSFTTSSGTNQSHTTNTSTTNSQTDGTTKARVYELIVEQTEIQRLPPTAFVYVESGLDQRRILIGDCNPEIAAWPRVAQ